MPLNPNLKKVMVIGSGPIVIGQAAEFDYAGTQACRALKEEGLEVVLVNSNPATIMTDAAMADHVYVEPLTLDFLKKIIKKEHPDSILSTLGGQTGLQTALDDGDGGRHSAVFTDELLHVHSGLHILRIGHTVGDDGALQRHHGLALLQSLFDLSGNVQITIQHDSVPPVDKFDWVRIEMYRNDKE